MLTISVIWIELKMTIFVNHWLHISTSTRDKMPFDRVPDRVNGTNESRLFYLSLVFSELQRKQILQWHAIFFQKESCPEFLLPNWFIEKMIYPGSPKTRFFGLIFFLTLLEKWNKLIKFIPK